MRLLSLAYAIGIITLLLQLCYGFQPVVEGWRLSDNNRKYNYKKRDADDGKLFRAPKENAALRRIFTERPPRNTETLLKLQKYFRNIDNKLRKKRATDRKNKQCDERGNWSVEARYYQNLRGMAGPNHCVVIEQVRDKFIPDLRSLGDELNRGYAKKFADAALGNGKWTSAQYIGGTDNVNGQSQFCSLRRQAAFRVNGLWFLALQFTNVPGNASNRNTTRSVLTEHVHVAGTKDVPRFSSMAMYLRNRSSVDVNENSLPPAATSLYHTRTYPGPSTFGKPIPAHNRALLEAMELVEHDLDASSDTLQLSNVAIIVVPLMLNLVPVALVADVNTAGMLLYMLFTDIVTALPLAIKGMELLLFTSTPRRVAISYLAGQSDTEDYHAVAEIFVAECRARENLRPTAIGLISASAFFMVLGVVLELIARVYTRRCTPASCSAHPGTSTVVASGPYMPMRFLDGARRCICACHTRKSRRMSDTTLITPMTLPMNKSDSDYSTFHSQKSR